jgi:transcriptional regulator with XRE-family HTH domain
MGKTQLSEFAWWHLTDVTLPERSMLYAPAPIGVGTAGCESLTSYLARLAEAHCVYPGVLLQQMLVPLMRELETQGSGAGEHPLWRRDGSGSHLINVTSPRARSVISALELLTLRTNLRGLALTALTDILPIRGLTRKTLAWCPHCYEEWQEREQPLYDPLLWMFREISTCTRHGVRLHTHCPHCARSLPHLTWRSRPGYCAFCSGALFARQEDGVQAVAVDSHEFAWQQWVTHALEGAIARLPGINVEPKRERIRWVVSIAVEYLTDGNVAAFARSLGLPRGTVENWRQGKRIPELDMLLRLCYRLDLSLGEVLFEEGGPLQPSLREPVPPARFPSRKRTAINQEHIAHQLEQAASSAENPPPSLKEVGLRLGYQPTTLYKINRVACHAIAERHTAYRRQLRERRLQGYREEIRRIALYLQAEQVTLTQRHISRYLAQPAILRDLQVRQLLREVCREVEERCKPGKSHDHP